MAYNSFPNIIIYRKWLYVFLTAICLLSHYFADLKRISILTHPLYDRHSISLILFSTPVQAYLPLCYVWRRLHCADLRRVKCPQTGFRNTEWKANRSHHAKWWSTFGNQLINSNVCGSHLNARVIIFIYYAKSDRILDIVFGDRRLSRIYSPEVCLCRLVSVTILSKKTNSPNLS